MENNVRPETMARINTKALADAFIAEQVAEIRAQVGHQSSRMARRKRICCRQHNCRKIIYKLLSDRMT